MSVQHTATGAGELAALVGRDLAPTPWVALSRSDHRRYDAATPHERSTNYSGGDAAEFVHGACGFASSTSPSFPPACSAA